VAVLAVVVAVVVPPGTAADLDDTFVAAQETDRPKG